MINLKNKKILVTGGSGFLGRVICKKLEERGAKVLAPRSTEMDLLSRASVENYFYEHDFDFVIHSAAYYGGLGINSTYPADIFYRNTIMYANVLEACAGINLDKIVLIGTACAFPDGLEILKEEDLWSGPVHKSVQNYGAVKKMMQIGLESYNKQHGLNGNHVLLANLYGEWDSYNPERSHVVAALIRKFVEAKMNNDSSVEIWGSGRPIREFLYIQDAAEGIVRATESYDDIEPMNIGTGIGTSIKGLVELIVEITEYNGEIVANVDKPDGQYKKIFDVTKMRDKLGWGPPTSLANGLIKTINWFEENYDEAIKRW